MNRGKMGVCTTAMNDRIQTLQLIRLRLNVILPLRGAGVAASATRVKREVWFATGKADKRKSCQGPVNT